MVSWDEDKGLQVFVDNRLVSSTTRYRLHTAQSIRDSNIYIGRPNRVTPGRYGDFTIDELELWYANVDHLKAFNLIDKGNALVVVVVHVRKEELHCLCIRCRTVQNHVTLYCGFLQQGHLETW